MTIHVDPQIEMTLRPVEDVMEQMGRRAKRASQALLSATAEQKRSAIVAAADWIERTAADIIEANAKDVEAAHRIGASDAFIDRLLLTESSVAEMSNALRTIAKLPDPVGKVIDTWDRPNGLDIERVRTPLGVIGVIYESRPNVTADAGALSLMAGNAVILRAGSSSIQSSRAIHACLRKGLVDAGLSPHAIQLVPVSDRSAVGHMLTGLNGSVDVIIPRGGKSLVERVQSEAKVPVFAHLEGLVHIYVDKAADPQMAKDIVINAKLRRTGVCGAVETLLVDAGNPIMASILSETLIEAGCVVRGDEAVRAQYPFVNPAREADWQTEYLDSIISVRMVDGLDGALEHIRAYSSNHTESVITEDPAIAERFLNEVDSAIVLHNASTQFADGGEFGMGAEIGIATGKMHARGPVGLEQLTSFKYRVRGSGQTRSIPPQVKERKT